MIVVLLLCSCDTIKKATGNQNERINEEFLAGWKTNEQYDPMDRATSIQEVPCNLGTDMVRCVAFVDDEHDIVGEEYHYTVDDTVMFTQRSYKRNGRVYKTVTEYDRDFYDRFEEDGLPENLRCPFSKDIVCFGELNSFLVQPYIWQGFYPDGSNVTFYYLLTSDGTKLYLDHGESYDAEGNQTSMFFGDTSGETADAIYLEEYEYEDGDMTLKKTYDYREGIETHIFYENGEETERQTFKIDEHGNRID